MSATGKSIQLTRRQSVFCLKTTAGAWVYVCMRTLGGDGGGKGQASEGPELGLTHTQRRSRAGLEAGGRYKA